MNTRPMEPTPGTRRLRVDMGAFVTAMLLGTAGGTVCFLLHVPLAFMIGSMLATTIAALGGVRTVVPKRLRDGLVIVLGIMLGSAFNPSLLGHLTDWSVSLAFMVVYIVLAALAGTLYLRRLARYDPLGGVTTARPPGLLVVAAQIVIGASIGGRFQHVPLLRIARTAGVALGLTSVLLSVTVLLAVGVHLLTDLSLPGLILAYAPGGLAEMSLVALALHVDAAFVATHHIARIMLIVMFAPAIYHLWRRWIGRGDRIT